MEESVIADFVGRIHTRDVRGNEPRKGRVLLSQRRLVLAGPDSKTTVPLTAVFDVAVGTVPDGLQSFFSDTVTVAYLDGSARRTAVVEGAPENMDRFRTVLFKALVHDATVTVRSPARIGGRVTDEPARTASVRLAPGEVGFVDTERPFTVDLGTVTGFERERRTLDGTTRPVLLVRHVVDGRSVTSMIALENDRRLNVLARYLKLEYAEVMEEVTELDPTEEELQILVAIYSAGGEATVGDVVTGDATRTAMLLDRLRDDGLVADGDAGATVTPKGRTVVDTYLESVDP